MAIPHLFPSLLGPSIQIVIIAGSGLSSPHVPLIEDLVDRLSKFADSLGVKPSVSPSDEHYFYDLAEVILDRLVNDGNSNESSLVLLAGKLGMLDDARWTGKVLPLSENTPRHRALARFAVEGRVRSIISLNWDTLLESAFESIGIKEENPQVLPWRITAYTCVVKDADISKLSGTNLFPIIKPHGCVKQLIETRNSLRRGEIPDELVFKIKKHELIDNNPDIQTIIDIKVQGYVSECPLLSLGWKASELYLTNTIIKTAMKVPRNESDRFTSVNIEWHESHSEIASAYSTTKEQSFVEVKKEENPTTDCLLLWLQARFTLNHLINVASHTDKPTINNILSQLDEPMCSHPVLNWCDYWLPAWLRLCWRSGAMQGWDQNTGKEIKPTDIPVVPRDTHIPLTGMSTQRRDLGAAARLLIVIDKMIDRYNFFMFPGGMWDPTNLYLYFFVPAWKESTEPSDLSAFKPMIDSISNFGFVRQLVVILLNSDDSLPTPEMTKNLEALVRREMRLTSFASMDSDKLIVDNISMLKGNDSV